MTAAVCNIHLSGQMIIADSPVRTTRGKAIAIARRTYLAQKQPVSRRGFAGMDCTGQSAPR